MVFVLGDVVQVVQNFSHAAKLIVQHVMPVLCPTVIDCPVNILDKVVCHACNYVQSYSAPSEEVMVQQAGHNLVNLQCELHSYHEKPGKDNFHSLLHKTMSALGTDIQWH